jgi:hypothetical protein
MTYNLGHLVELYKTQSPLRDSLYSMYPDVFVASSLDSLMADTVRGAGGYVAVAMAVRGEGVYKLESGK